MALSIIAILLTNPGCGPHGPAAFKARRAYGSKDLTVMQIAENTFVHTSFKKTDDFGNVPCNGLIIRQGSEAVVFDTSTNDEHAQELIDWIRGSLHCRINAVVLTHFHDDRLGGLKAFHDRGIPSFACSRTIELAGRAGMTVPGNSFADTLTLNVGGEVVTARFFGEGHTPDNVVGYFPREHVLFGGCLVKELDADKGYLGDANVTAWPATVERVERAYPNVAIVVPGHGEPGDKALLDYTVRLFSSP